MLIGEVDGEFYGESFPLLAAAGWWVIFNLVLVPLDIARVRPVPATVCGDCGYDLTGLRAGTCPECGRAMSNKPGC